MPDVTREPVALTIESKQQPVFDPECSLPGKSPRALRALARAFVRCAVSRRVRSQGFCRAMLERQLEAIAGDIEALIWAAGCVWALRVEAVMARAHPVVNCALFLAGLYVGVDMLLAHLTWYGVQNASTDMQADVQRVFIKLGVYLCIVVIVGLVTPGPPRRRVFAASMFPLVGALGMVAIAVGLQFADCIRLTGYWMAEAVLRGLALGLLIATITSLPNALLYRGAAVPVAILSLLPALAKVSASGQVSHPRDGVEASICHLGSYLCALVVVAASTYACDRFQSAPLGVKGGGRS